MYVNPIVLINLPPASRRKIGVDQKLKISSNIECPKSSLVSPLKVSFAVKKKSLFYLSILQTTKAGMKAWEQG